MTYQHWKLLLYLFFCMFSVAFPGLLHPSQECRSRPLCVQVVGRDGPLSEGRLLEMVWCAQEK